ncbi:MAG: hypothetical protein QF733_00430 [Phycisphaerales bacterium]|jgi:hypothetical protein|nr:hypothetical protein [Phycisphaerales bacterium]
MPRAAAFRCGIIGELHRQLSWAPDEACERLIDSAESLVREIDLDRAYPVEFITFRLTGWKPDAASHVESVAGEALLADLVTMVQRISRRVPMDVAAGDVAVLDLDDIARALSVSRRTLVRIRRLGLLMRYGRMEDGSLRLVCAPDMLDWFRRTRADHIAGRAVPATPAEVVIELARALQPIATIQAAVRAIAPQCPGRSPQAIRSILRRAVASGRVQVSSRGRLTPREGRLAARAQWRGIPNEEVAERLGVSAAAAHRAAARWRADRVRAISLSLQQSEDDGPESETVLLAEGARSGLPPWNSRVSLEPPERPAAEAHLLAASHMLLRRVHQGVAALASQPSVQRLDRIETDLRWMTRLRWHLMMSLGLVVHQAVLARLGRQPSTMPADVQRVVLHRATGLIGDVLDRQSVASFDRLAIRVRAAVDRMLAGVRAVDPGHASVRHPEAVSVPLTSLSRWSGLLPDPRWHHAVNRLSGAQAEVCQARWGFAGDAPLTLAEIAGLRRSSRQKVAAISAAAHRNLVLESRSPEIPQ